MVQPFVAHVIVSTPRDVRSVACEPVPATSTHRRPYAPPVEDRELVAALRAGDEAAFARIVREWHPSMLRVARIFVPSWSLADEVVQETWVRVIGALDRFEERSSLKTWVFRIL